MKPKFQVGDIVIAFRTMPDHRLTPTHPEDGAIVTIKGITRALSSGAPFVYWFQEYSCGRFEDELEFANIYNSPLYKALS